MAGCAETLHGILSRIKRLETEIAMAQGGQTRRASFENLCAAYSILVREAGEALGRTFPVREVRQEDLGLSVGIVCSASLRDLVGLVVDLRSALERVIEASSHAFNALPCPKAAGRPCQMHSEINLNRFDVFFAIPSKNPPTCKDTCDALIEWLKKEHVIEEKRIFRATRGTYFGDFVCKICKTIQESRVVVTDITGGNANVFFELRLAVGLGKPSILIYDEKATEARIPSDLLAWEYVPYDGKNPSEKDWLEHFGIVFDGTRQRRRILQ